MEVLKPESRELRDTVNVQRPCLHVLSLFIDVKPLSDLDQKSVVKFNQGLNACFMSSIFIYTVGKNMPYMWHKCDIQGKEMNKVQRIKYNHHSSVKTK